MFSSSSDLLNWKRFVNIYFDLKKFQFIIYFMKRSFTYCKIDSRLDKYKSSESTTEIWVFLFISMQIEKIKSIQWIDRYGWSHIAVIQTSTLLVYNEINSTCERIFVW